MEIELDDREIETLVKAFQGPREDWRESQRRVYYLLKYYKTALRKVNLELHDTRTTVCKLADMITKSPEPM